MRFRGGVWSLEMMEGGKDGTLEILSSFFFVNLSPGSNQTPGLAHSCSPGAYSGVHVDLEPTAFTGTLSLRDSFFLYW